MQREAREEVLRQNEEAKRRRRKHVPVAIGGRSPRATKSTDAAPQLFDDLEAFTRSVARYAVAFCIK